MHKVVMTKGKTKKEIEHIRKKREAIDLRKDALSLRAIGERMGISHEYARKLVLEGLEDLRKDMVDEVDHYRSMQVARREEIINAHKDIATDPSNEGWKASADIIDKNETAISKLMGTDQPIKIEAKTEVTGDAGPAVVFEVHHPSVEPSFTPPEPEDDGDDNIST